MKIMPWAAFQPAHLPARALRTPEAAAAAPRDRVHLSGLAEHAPAERGRLPHGMVEVGGGAVRYSPGAGALRTRLEERGVRVVGIRHGQTEMNARPEPVLCGQNETSLTPKGREQAAAAARQILEDLGGSEWLRRAAANPDLLPVIYTSPLSRARDTAQVFADLAGGVPVTPDDRLLEIHFGTQEMSTVSDFGKACPEFGRSFDAFAGEGANFLERFPGGESRADVVNRVSSLLQEIADRHPGRTVLLFCHQETLVAARAALGLARTAEGKLRADSPTIGNAVPLNLTRPPVPQFLSA